MSFVRARPKIPVVIPNRRRPAVNLSQPSKETVADNSKNGPLPDDCNDSSATSSSVPSLGQFKPEPQDDMPLEKPAPPPTESKQFFKRIKPPVLVPAKKPRSRPTLEPDKTNKTLVSESSLKTEEPPVSEPATIPAAEFVQPDNSVKLERVATPPPSVPPCAVPSPAKSPAKSRLPPTFASYAALRRHSVQPSSASESEDDTRKIIAARSRKISEGSVFTQPVDLEEQTVDNPGDVNECVRLALLPKKRKAKASNHVRKIAEARRNFHRRCMREKPDRSNLKMFDLLFYNPIDEHKIPTASADQQVVAPEQEILDEALDDPVPKEEQEDAELAMPVPQVKIGANGEIILDEKSLVIETTYSKKCKEAMKNSVPVFEDHTKRTTYYGKKHNKAKEWSPVDLKCFYKALNSIGTDFALMEPLFPGRSRAELKNKFKREEKVNQTLIDKALGRPMPFNIAALKEEFEREREQVAVETRKKLSEMQRDAQEKKHSLGNEYKAIDEQALRQHAEFPDQTRRSKRKSVGRKFNSEFVDPFDSDEVALTEKQSTGNALVAVEETKESLVPVEMKEIKQQEFFKLFTNNLGKMQPTTITVAAPSDKSDQIQLILDVGKETLDDSEMEIVYVLQEEGAALDQVVADNNNLVRSEEIVDSPPPVSDLYRNVGDLTYVVFRNDKGSFESQMSQVKELKPGTLVVMLSVAPNIPIENRCSLFMMVSKETESGVQVSAMPVVLPPELMKLLMNDLDQS